MPLKKRTAAEMVKSATKYQLTRAELRDLTKSMELWKARFESRNVTSAQVSQQRKKTEATLIRRRKSGL